MRNQTVFVTLAVCATAIVITAINATAGPLNPPPGPVAPTSKPLPEIEPRTAVNAANTPGDADSLFKITAPGSYYLTGNVAGATGLHGIEIAAAGVTLDLMGFELVGVPGSRDGVRASGFIENTHVRDGAIRGWGQSGVSMSSARSSTLENLRTSNNGRNGILSGTSNVIDRCTARMNAASGIVAGGGSVVTGCTASFNTIDGFSTSTNCSVVDSVAESNAASGIGLGDGGAARGCTARRNGLHGIVAQGGAKISGNVVTLNDLDGINVSSDALVEGNVCDGNGFNGIGAGIHARGIDNRIEGNAVTDNDRGIDIDSLGNFILRNSARNNAINYEVAAGNACLVLLATTGGAINGSSGGVSPGTTNPWANFSF